MMKRDRDITLGGREVWQSRSGDVRLLSDFYRTQTLIELNVIVTLLITLQSRRWQ